MQIKNNVGNDVAFSLLLGIVHLLSGIQAGEQSAIDVCPTRTIYAGESGIYHHVTSPGHPGTYDNNRFCRLTVKFPLDKTIHIIMTFVDLPSIDLSSSSKLKTAAYNSGCGHTTKDEVKVVAKGGNGQTKQRHYCTATHFEKNVLINDIPNNCSSMEITFSTDGSINGRGFELLYRWMDKLIPERNNSTVSTIVPTKPTVISSGEILPSHSLNHSSSMGTVHSRLQEKERDGSSISTAQSVVIPVTVTAATCVIILLTVILVKVKRRKNNRNSSPKDKESDCKTGTDADTAFYEEVDNHILPSEIAPSVSDNSPMYEEVDIRLSLPAVGYTGLDPKEMPKTDNYHPLLKKEVQYEIPENGQAEGFKDMVSPDSNYTELKRRQDRRNSEDDGYVYEQLLPRDSVYVIPANTGRDSYHDVQPSRNMPGYTELDENIRKLGDDACYEKLIGRENADMNGL